MIEELLKAPIHNVQQNGIGFVLLTLRFEALGMLERNLEHQK